VLDCAASAGILPGTLLRTLVTKHVSFTSQEAAYDTGGVAAITRA
jgi:hypothetical protein